MRCLVTGCAGFIGSTLSEQLLKEGHSVVGIDCFTDYYAKKTKRANLAGLRLAKDFEFVEADLASTTLSPLVKHVDAVFHLAAQPGVRTSWGETFSGYVKNNIVATQRLLEAVKGANVKRFIYASSSSVYGDSESLPTAEDAVPKPVSPYGVTKLTGEHLCYVYYKNYSVPTVILRYFTVYGPRQRPDMAFNRFITKIAHGEEIQVYGDGEQTRDFTYVGDTVAGTILASQAFPGSVYNVGGGASTSLNEVISLIEAMTGRKARLSRKENAAGDVKSTAADIGRISKDLGYRPKTSLAEGLRKQVAFQVG